MPSPIPLPPEPADEAPPLDPRHPGVVHDDPETQLYVVRSILDVLAAQGFEPPAEAESIRRVLFIALDTLDDAIATLEQDAQQPAQEGQS
jgi:hypothetical protein